ncbi:hypothetical protein BB560_001691 [Smittium megazygosporum]|uniref:Svf1-like C-terminal domain-containing protein n=1 Tax=Smittium megazygosporum TaxID=133381 RepID=A0A2T9ZH34_9FUNG|nr:hypothetical protein BB560_001691 [Smittium megazygosporum]
MFHFGSSTTETALSTVPPGTSPICKLKKEDLEWVCHGSGTESDTIYFRLENGTFVLLQFACAKISVSTTYQTNMMICEKGENPIFETLENSKMTIDSDKISVTCDRLKIQFNKDITGLTMSYTGKDDLRIELSSKFISEGYKIGETPNKIAGGTANHVFYPRVSVQATLEHSGKKVSESGTGIFIRAASSGILPYNIGARWYLSLVDNPDFYFHILQYTTPKKYGAVTISQAALIRDQKPAVYFYDNKLKLEDLDKSLNKTYELPRRVVYTLKGQTEDKKNATLTYNADLSNFIYEIRALAAMNPILKSLIHALVTNPILFDFMETDAKLVLKVDGEKEEVLSGTAYHELTFMS